MNKQIKTRKRISLVLALCLVMSLVAGSLAYFTDRVELDAKVTAGTVGISESQTWQDNLYDADGNRILNNINPGDSRSLAFSITNTGNKAIDVRHTIKLSVVDANNKAKEMSMGADVNGESMLQFDIFKASDVLETSEASGNKGYVLKDGAKPVFSTSTLKSTTQMGVDRKYDAALGICTYYFADTVLDGVGDQAEINYAMAEQVETELTNTDVVLSNDNTTVSYDYVLIFRDSTLNDFQGSTVHLEMVVEAKQHLNTKSSWQNIETVSVDMAVSPDNTQDTTIEAGPNNQTGVLEDVENGDAGDYNNNVAH